MEIRSSSIIDSGHPDQRKRVSKLTTLAVSNERHRLPAIFMLLLVSSTVHQASRNASRPDFSHQGTASMSTSDMNSVFAAKKALRKATGATLKALDQAHISQESLAVRLQIHKQSILENARGISCYLSMDDGELSTTGLVQDILAANIPLFVPVIPLPQSKSAGADRYAAPPPEHDMRMLRLYSLDDFERCPKDKWGIPDASSQRRDQTEETRDGKRQDAEDLDAPPLDVILVPGVKFDHACGRVGHGKGYYDRYIQRYRQTANARQHKPPMLVALALQEQLSETLVPRTESDELVDMVVLPQQVIKR